MLLEPFNFHFQRRAAPGKRPQNRALDRRQVGFPTAFGRLDMAGARRGGRAESPHGFSQIIVVDEPDFSTGNDDLYFVFQAAISASRIAKC